MLYYILPLKEILKLDAFQLYSCDSPEMSLGYTIGAQKKVIGMIWKQMQLHINVATLGPEERPIL